MANLEQLVEDLSALTILEAAELKKMLEEKWGVEAAVGGPMMVAAGAMPAAAPVEEEEEKTEFDVVLEDAGPKKINVIKAVRALTSLGLKEAKDLVEGTPSTVLEAVNKEAAEDAKSKLEAEGGKVSVK
ncbi:MAG: 50S ribosomal protein L7/L12 [Chloroflexota bacterium]